MSPRLYKRVVTLNIADDTERAALLNALTEIRYLDIHVTTKLRRMQITLIGSRDLIKKALRDIHGKRCKVKGKG